MKSHRESSHLDVERTVQERYTDAAGSRSEDLCCPQLYDPRLLEAIPEEVLQRDYGCGDPSRYVREGDTVLDLGSGGGKICFIASQIVGAKGCVIGIDMTDQMLGLSRSAAPTVAERIGYANVTFHKARIQDLALDLGRLEGWLRENPVQSAEGLSALEDVSERLRHEHPLVPDASVDIVISNCVLNLVRDSDKPKLIREIFRVLKPGGRIAISDIVSDEFVPADLKADPELWSGCIAGAFQEEKRELEAAGFYGIAWDRWEEEPFRVVQGIEFRALTVTARKGKEGPCFEANQAVIYRGPWRKVEDDDGHVLRRGERTAVCAKTYRLFTRAPYEEHVVPVPSRVPVPEGDQRPFDCERTAPRHPRETKGEAYLETSGGDGSCCPTGEC
jgi:SAM-dependent methyltransferase